ncbi:MAG: type II secretion system minor pseudopilin GspJ [Gammaproteobacteria bacterium]|nr:type II secretion system minor pseudopilin GspJ [Gammaproteobacteria bacterium]
MFTNRNFNKLTQPFQQGFTLLEILIAMFIFTILSMLLAGALRTVINVEARTSARSQLLRTMQMGFVILARDIEQAVNRPIVNEQGHEEAAFVGTPTSFTFTHLGNASGLSGVLRSDLQRVRYHWQEGELLRSTWMTLDQPPGIKPLIHPFIKGITAAQFQYLDQRNRMHDYWPINEGSDEILPRAISLNFTIAQWGKMSQLYIVEAQPIKKDLTQTQPQDQSYQPDQSIEKEPSRESS